MRSTADMIESAARYAHGGVALNQEVMRGLDEIRSRVERVGTVMSEIAAGSAQQSEGVRQISTAVDQMNSVTEQVAASSEQSAAAAEQLTGRASALIRLVDSFVVSDTETARQIMPELVPQPAKVNGKAHRGNGRSRDHALAGF
jgi:methyl-accepting chemotaxis protein